MGFIFNYNETFLSNRVYKKIISQKMFQYNKLIINKLIYIIMKKYLSEIISELPKNCLYDKGECGCGASALALESKERYVICFPFVSLVENKYAQYPNERRSESLFKVTGDGCHYKVLNQENSWMQVPTDNSLEAYLETTQYPKIVCTYDSLGKVVDMLGNKVKDFNLLIDEFHILFTAYSYREEAVHTVLSNFRKFGSFCFMTATTLEKEFLLEELKYIPIVKQEWENTTPVKIDTYETNNVEATTVSVIKGFLNGQYEGNGYFFVNSVKFIKRIIGLCGLTEENCRVIYSKNNKTVLPIKNGSTLDAPKKINFLTSTVFEGSDIYDEDGRTIIISDSFNPNTLLDISTSVQQIIGRIRNSKYINNASHIYSLNRYYGFDTYEQFKVNVDSEVEKCKKAIETFNYADESFKQAAFCNNKDFSLGIFTKQKDGLIVLDENKIKIDLFNYKVAKGLYRLTVNLDKEYAKYGIETENIKLDTKSLDIKYKEQRLTFKEYCEGARKEFESGSLDKPIYDEGCYFYPFLKEAVEKLGFEKISTLRYVQKDIKNAVAAAASDINKVKVFKIIERHIQAGTFYPVEKIKKWLQEAYDTIGIKKTAKATDVSYWFNVNEAKKRIDGKLVRIYNVVSKKYILK